MTFRSAVTASTLFHVAVFLLLAFFPDAPPKPSGTRFYVDYVHLGGGKLPGQKASGGQAAQPRTPARGERSSGKVRELRTKPERKTELTYTEGRGGGGEGGGGRGRGGWLGGFPLCLLRGDHPGACGIGMVPARGSNGTEGCGLFQDIPGWTDSGDACCGRERG